MNTSDRIPPSSPPENLSGFPCCELPTSRSLYRGHLTGNSPWWFSWSPWHHEISIGQRFDVDSSRGTCYLAYDDITAVQEAVGAPLTSSGVISVGFASARHLSTLTVLGDRSLADLCADEAEAFDLPVDLGETIPFDVPQDWASAFCYAGFGGLQYRTRFATCSAANAVAIFGAADRERLDWFGPAPAGHDVGWPVDPTPEPFGIAAARAGFTVASPPHTVRIVAPAMT